MTREPIAGSPLAARLFAMRGRALVAANAGLAIGYALVLLRDLAAPDIIAATDFTVFWSAWSLILHGHAAALYDEAAQRAMQRLLMNGGYFEGGLMAFLNPPHAALAGVPFGWLAERAGEPAAFAAWAACNLALLALLIRVVFDEWGPAPRFHRWILGSAIVAFYPVFVTIKNGQLSIVLALAVFGVYRAARSSRHWTAGAWLTVLTIKPQLVPVVVIYLAGRRCWRALAAAGVLLAGVGALTSLVLGPAVWIEYLRHVHYLEQFWGTGTPDYMLNLRGTLTRILGLDHLAAIDAAGYVIWLASTCLLAVVVYRHRPGNEQAARAQYAFVTAVGLLSNPHVFIHDTVIWIVPLLFCAVSIREAGDDWLPFASFALAWPAVFAVAGRLDIRSGPLTWLDLHTWTFMIAVVAIGRRSGTGDTSRRRSRPPVVQPALLRTWTS